jgi:hypothetical protein
MPRRKRGEEVVAPEKEQDMTEYGQYGDGSTEATIDEAAGTETENLQPEATTTEAAATPAQPQKVTSEEMMREKFAEGSLVEVTTKGSDYTKQQGRVTGYEEKRGAWYIKVAIEVNAGGQRRAAAKEIVTRWQSLTSIDEYRPVPVSAQTVAAQEAVAATQGG